MIDGLKGDPFGGKDGGKWWFSSRKIYFGVLVPSTPSDVVVLLKDPFACTNTMTTS